MNTKKRLKVLLLLALFDMCIIRSLESTDLIKKLYKLLTPKKTKKYKKLSLHFAVLKLNSKIVKKLLDVEVDPEVDPNVTDSNGNTPLHYTVIDFDRISKTDHIVLKQLSVQWKEYYQVFVRQVEEKVKLLLEYGANPDIQNSSKESPLHLAARFGCGSIVSLLLEYGVSTNLQDSNGRTALHLASCFGCGSIVDLLFKYGANPNLRDNNGNTAFDIAHQKMYVNIEDMINCKIRRNYLSGLPGKIFCFDTKE